MTDTDHKDMSPEVVEAPASKFTRGEADLEQKTREREIVLSLSSPNNDADLEGKAIGYLQKADDCLRKCKSAADITSLNKTIALLAQAASTCPKVHPHYSECYNQFATALLIRFIYTGKAEDVQNAVNLRAGPVLGHPVEVNQSTAGHEKANTQDMIKNATMILTNFLHAHDQALLKDAILLYQEALELLPESHLQRWKMLWELSEGLLIQYHLTGNVTLLEEAIACLHQVQEVKPNHSICLCAALATGCKGPSAQSNMLMAMDLANQIGHRNAKALKMAQIGQASFRSFNMDLDSMKLEEAMKYFEEAESLLSWGHNRRAPLLNLLGASFGNYFELKGNIAVFKKSIEALRESVKLQNPTDPNRSASLHNLATAVQKYYDLQRDPNDLEEAIRLHREALEIHATPHPDRGHSLNHLADALQMRFTRERNLKDIDEAIQLHREALEIHGIHHRDHSTSLNNLAAAVQTRFKHRGDPKDIDEAVKLLRKAMEICAAPHPKRDTALNNLASALHARFHQHGNLKDIHDAIELLREAVEICPSHQDRSAYLSNLAKVVYTRFNHRGDRQDIEEAIKLNRAALKMRTSSHPDHGTSLNHLASAIHTRFHQWGDPKDIDEAIQLHKDALNICATSDQPVWLSDLASALHTRFKQQGNSEDLNESLQLHRQALEICPACHPGRSMILDNFARAIGTHCGQQGDPRDNDKAIQMFKEALENRIAPYSKQSSLLKNLADAVRERFFQHGDPKDLDESIQLHREALEIRAAPHPDRSRSLKSLGTAILTRFRQRGDQRDIDEAIQLHREALDTCVPSYPDRSMLLNALGNAVYIRAVERGDQTDLDEAIQLYGQALEICAAPHPAHSQYLSKLATAIQTRYTKLRDPQDIDEAIKLYKQAMDIHSAPHSEYNGYLNGLAFSFYARFEQHKDPKDIDKAVLLHRELRMLSPASHPDRCMWLANFGCILHAAYSYQPNEKILDEAISVLQEASTYPFASPLSRFDASSAWAAIAAVHGHDSGLAAYHTCISLLPQLAAFHLDLKSRQNILTRGTTLASSSAMYAIGLKQNNVAVEFLEASRSIFWAQALHLRIPLDHLAKADPQLANRLSKLSKKLEQASFRDISRDLLTDTQRHAMAIEAEATRCRKLNEDWDETIKAVQKLPDFKDFMRIKSIASLRRAAVTGPIIIFLASKSTCAALIVTSSEEVQHVALPGTILLAAKLYSELLNALTMGTVDIMAFLDSRGHNDTDQSDLEVRLFGSRDSLVKYVNPDEAFRRILAEIWTTIVKPVFYVMGLKKSARPPRLWWCPTGPFAFLPIHAAGIYDEQETDCVSDYVISSYTPTLATLLDPPTYTTAPFKMMAVIEPNAPNCSPLPGTAAELATIVNKVPDQVLTSRQSPTGLEVARNLQQSSIVHFACHGVQDSRNPLDSGLMLSDGRLKVSEIMRRSETDNMEADQKGMSLAFLSACETAKGDDARPDEAMHLAATLLFAGFRGVVATMWTMTDADGPKIADSFYEHLFKDCDLNSTPPIVPDLTKAAEALHLAVSKLRKEPGMTFRRWVPFVHYGL